MKVKRTAALLLAILMIVMVCLCGCNNSEQTKKAEETQAPTQASSAPAADSASSQIGSGENYSSSAGVDMADSGNSSSMSGSSREVKFKDDKARSVWDTLYQDRYVFFWTGSNNKMTTWPGEKMTKDASGVYHYTIPVGATSIIFSAGTDLYQTVDIPFDGSVTEYQLTGERDDNGKYLVETWDGSKVDEVKPYDSVKNVSSSEIGISIEGISIQKGYYEGSFTNNGGHDAAIIKVKNNLNVAVHTISFYAAFLDSSGTPIQTILGSYSNNGSVAKLTTNNLTLQPGETTDVGYMLDASSISSQYAIVESYTSADGVHYVNTDADSWAAKYIK